MITKTWTYLYCVRTSLHRWSSLVTSVVVLFFVNILCCMLASTYESEPHGATLKSGQQVLVWKTVGSELVLDASVFRANSPRGNLPNWCKEVNMIPGGSPYFEALGFPMPCVYWERDQWFPLGVPVRVTLPIRFDNDVSITEVCVSTIRAFPCAVYLPHAGLDLLAGFPLAPLLAGSWIWLRGRWRRAHGLCPQCAYSLVNINVSRCPECGVQP